MRLRPGLGLTSARTAAICVVAALAAGCSTPPPAAVATPSASPSAAPSLTLSSTPVRVEPEDANARRTCATAVLAELVRAFNAGDASALERAIGPGPIGGQGFQWVSFADGVGRNAEYTAEGARRMLLERWSLGQRLTLTRVEAGAGPSWHGGVDASVWLESRAPGVGGVAPLFGKTVLSCVGGRVQVLSIGDE